MSIRGHASKSIQEVSFNDINLEIESKNVFYEFSLVIISLSVS